MAGARCCSWLLGILPVEELLLNHFVGFRSWEKAEEGDADRPPGDAGGPGDKESPVEREVSVAPLFGGISSWVSGFRR